MQIAPFLFASQLLPKVWGGRRLAEVLRKPLPDDQPYGEAWEVSDHASHVSRVKSGPWSGLTLRDLMRSHRADLLGPTSNSTTFPLLIKFLDARDWLSVQVHPNNEQVQRFLPGEGGKTEAWFVLEAQPGSRIYAGLLPGVIEATLHAALQRGTVTECLHSYEPQAGDCLFLPAGTVHAVGGGVLMAEVQQTSDATFRLFDWNRCDANGRSRPLHVEQALACIDWQRGPIEPERSPWFTKMPTSGIERHPLVDCDYFHVADVRGAQTMIFGDTDRLQVLIVLQGGGRLQSPDGEMEMSIGDVWMLPAASPQVQCIPKPSLGALLVTPK